MRAEALIRSVVCALGIGLPPLCGMAAAQSLPSSGPIAVPPPGAPQVPSPAPTPPAPAGTASAPRWTGFFNVDTYLLPDDEDYLQPTVSADRGALHLEARYNYEDLRTGSVFAGWNGNFGESVAVGVTPMLGLSFGRTAAVIPAFRAGVSFWRIEGSAEGEWAFAFDDEDDSFFYAWLEADFSLTDWMWVGISSQTTAIFGEPQETEWGPLVGFAIGPLNLSTYVFNLADSSPSVIISAVFNFGGQ